MRPGDTLGAYVLQELIGQGGRGAVFRATQVSMRRDVALKVMLPGMVGDADRGRFQREMRLAAAITHPRLVQIFDGGIVDGTPYIAMEHLQGQTLRELVDRGGPLAARDAAPIARDVAEGVACLHEHGILHRDIKPENVFLSERGVKLLDLGLARTVDCTRLTVASEIMGTLPYLAPELVIGGADATAASDLWALGVTLHVVLSGQHPFPARSVQELAELLDACAVPEIAGPRGGVHEGLLALIAALLQKEPGRRPRTAALVCERLTELLDPRARRRSGGSRSPAPAPRAVSGPGDATRPLAARAVPASARRPRPAWGLLVVATLAIGVTAGLRSHAPAPEPGAPSIASTRPPAAPASPAPSRPPPSVRSAPEPLPGSIELFTWLNDPRPTARPPCDTAHPDPRVLTAVDSVYPQLELEDLEQSIRPADLARFLGAVQARPQDGCTWVALGYVLERDGQDAASRRAYDTGLSRLSAELLRRAPLVTWTGLARALAQVPGHDIEREWLPRVPPDLADMRAYEGLQHAWKKSDRALVARILSAGQADPARGPACVRALAQLNPDKSAGETGRIRTLVAGLQRYPQSEEIATDLFELWLRRGEVPDCRPFLPGLEPAARARWQRVLDLVEAPSPAGATAPGGRTVADEIAWEIQLGDCVRAGRRDEAARMAQARAGELGDLHDGTALLRRLGLLDAGGCGAAWRLSRDREPRDADPWDRWQAVLDVFSLPDAGERMREIANRAGMASGSRARAALAVWEARRGDTAAALADLDAALRTKPGDVADAAIAEVHFWSRWLAPGERPAAPLAIGLERASGRTRRFVRALDEDRLADALDEAKGCFAAHPGQSFWAIALSCLVARTGPSDARLWRSRVKAAARFRRCGSWALAVIEREGSRPTGVSGSTVLPGR